MYATAMKYNYEKEKIRGVEYKIKGEYAAYCEVNLKLLDNNDLIDKYDSKYLSGKIADIIFSLSGS